MSWSFAGGVVCVIAASRCGAGDTLRSTYGVPGTEIDLQERGVLMAGALSPAKARLRLQVALANGVAPSSVFPSRTTPWLGHENERLLVGVSHRGCTSSSLAS